MQPKKPKTVWVQFSTQLGSMNVFDNKTIINYFFFSYCQSQNGFEELRLHVKEGGDLCKELSAILQERSVLSVIPTNVYRKKTPGQKECSPFTSRGVLFFFQT
jgi:hypothetical protein